MTNVIEFLKGKKTYAVAGVTFIIGGLQAIGYPIPEWVFPLLGAFGLTALRAGVGKV